MLGQSVDAFSRCVRSMCSDPLIQLKALDAFGRIRNGRSVDAFGRCVQSMRSVDAFGRWVPIP